MTNTRLDKFHATTERHLITPPRNLVAQWIAEGNRQEYCTTDEYLIDKVAQWGYEQRGAVNEAALQKARDEELEACCEQLRSLGPGQRTIDNLRAARRPKPPSLKEQAQRILVEKGTRIDGRIELDPNDIDIIRRALQTLHD